MPLCLDELRIIMNGSTRPGPDRVTCSQHRHDYNPVQTCLRIKNIKKNSNEYFTWIQIYKYHGINFAAYWLYNFEIRVGQSDELGNNDICHKQSEVVDSVETRITCSRDLYGDWVSINKTEIPPAKSYLVLEEVRVFGSTCKLKNSAT